jgi:hypothetical protein
MLEALFGKHTHLEHNFPNSIFPTASFNCGPKTISLDHADFGNLSHGLCVGTGKKLWRYCAGHAMLHGSHGNGMAIAQLARYWHGTGKVAWDAW